MPQIGERKTIGGTTGEWNGSTWIEVPPNAAGPEPAGQGSAISRFLGGAVSHSPIGGLYQALTHPLDTAGGLLKSGLVDPITEGIEAGRSAVEAVRGGPNGRLIPALEALKHTAGAIPLVGKSLTDSGEKIGQGDVAGGLGELAGTASWGALPKVAEGAKGVPDVMRSAARHAGPLLETAGEHLSNPVIQGSAIGGSLMHGNIPAATAAAVGPRMMSAAGRGLRNFAGEAPGESMSAGPGLGMGYDPYVQSAKGTLTDAYPGIFEEVYGPDSAPTDSSGNPVGLDSVTPESLGALKNAMPAQDLAEAQPAPRKSRMDPAAQDAQLKKDSAYSRGIAAFFDDPALQAKRRAAIDAIKQLDSFQGMVN